MEGAAGGVPNGPIHLLDTADTAALVLPKRHGTGKIVLSRVMPGQPPDAYHGLIR